MVYEYQALLIIVILFTFPVGLSYAIDVIDTRFFADAEGAILEDDVDAANKLGLQKTLVRSALVAIPCIVGAFVPDFAVFSNFVSSIFLSTLGFIFPPMFHYALTQANLNGKARPVLESVEMLMIFCFGVFFFVAGLTAAFVNVL